MSVNIRSEVEGLINKIEALLDSQGEYFTEGTKVAMADQVNRGKAILEGTYQVPFIRNREFLIPREDEDLHFCYDYFSRAPSYHMTHYGLKPAYEWLLKKHIVDDASSTLEEKSALVIEKAQETLRTKEKANVSDEVIAAIKTGVEVMANLEGKDLGKKIVNIYDLIREVNHSSVIKTIEDSRANLFFSGKGLEAFRSLVEEDSVINETYLTIKEFADDNTLEQIGQLESLMKMDIDYEEANKHFNLWSTTDKIINFRSPKKAAFAKMMFVLPSIENEVDGLGHVWIDDLKVYSESGPNWPIANGGFEEGDKVVEGWTSQSLSGQAGFDWVDKAPFNSAAKVYVGGVFGHGTPSENVLNIKGRSLYIENETAKDCGAWVHNDYIAVEEDVNNTITFMAKIDGKLKKGIKVVIDFYDVDKNKIDDYECYFNRKSCQGAGQYALTAQTDAIVYAVSGELDYGVKVKKQLQFIMNDFCQGAEHWEIFDSRPDGSDAYGAVQGGRILCSVMSAYTLIRDAEVFDEAEMALFVRQLDFFVRYLLDLRDRTELSPYQAQVDAGNWQTDMAAGTGFLMMAMPEFAQSKQWLGNANMILRSQLAMKVNEDGSWPESVRYHFAALSRFLIYSRVLNNCTGENWFTDGPLIDMFKYAVDMQTPPYAFKDGAISTIIFGDHVLDGGRGYVLAGLYCGEVAKYDVETANGMLQSWKKAGSNKGIFSAEAVTIENLFIQGEKSTFEEVELDLKSSKKYKDIGFYTFRNHYGTENESLFTLIAPPKKVSHGHYDVGSFMIFKACQPIVVDLGIGGYFDSSKDWYISSSSHNLVQFSREGGKAEPQPYTIHLEVSDYSERHGWLDGPRTCEVVNCELSDELDTIEVKIPNTEGAGQHTRRVDYYKEADVYVVTDKIDDFERDVRFNLCVASSESVINGSRVASTGFFDVDLDVVFLSKLDSLEVEKGRTAPQFPETDGQYTVDVIRAISSGGEGFMTVIYPKKRGMGSVEVTRNENETRITTPEGEVLICMT